MEELTIKHGAFIVVRRVLGVITLVSAILMLIAHLGSLKIFDWIFITSFIISGSSLLTNGFGTEKSFIQSGEEDLKIKWLNKIRPVIIQDSKIEKITLTRMNATINREGGKPLKLNLDFLEREQKKEVYDFLIEYARKRNLILKRDF